MTTIDNFFDEAVLVPNIKGAAYFILLYEHFEDVVINTVKEFFSTPCVLDGVLYSDIDDDYIKKLKNKIEMKEEDPFIPYSLQLRQAQKNKKNYEDAIYASKENKENNQDGKRLRGALNWLQKYDVFSETDIKRVFDIRNRRNTVVHELFKVLGEGLSTNDAHMIADLLKFNDRVNNWRFQQLDMPACAIELPDGVQPEDVLRSDDMTLMGIFRILFCNEGEVFKSALEKVRNDETTV